MKDFMQKITKYLNQNNYKYYGLRWADEYKKEQVSRVWELGEPTDSVLSGLSVMGINQSNIDKVLNEIHFYSGQGDHLYLLASDEAYSGEDRGEIVLDEYSHELLVELL